MSRGRGQLQSRRCEKGREEHEEALYGAEGAAASPYHYERAASPSRGEVAAQVFHVVAEPGGECCDFCTARPVFKTYACHNFMWNKQPFAHESIGAWAACESKVTAFLALFALN